MLTDKKIGIIGSGNMGEALLRGLIGSGASRPDDLICSDVREKTRDYLHRTYGIQVTADNTHLVQQVEIVIYAVKPQLMAAVLKETEPWLDGSKLIISIAAGVPMEAIGYCLNKDLRLIRVMPNIAVAVREGATAVAAGKHASREDVMTAKAIFDSVGETVLIEENVLMDAITGLSGSGPAYIFLIVDALADAGVKMGLHREDAIALATQTVLGAAKLLKETREHPGQLKDRVTSPGGTAIAGLHTLEKGGLRTTLINAVEAATHRSRELGEMMVKNFAAQNGYDLTDGNCGRPSP